MDLLYSVLVDGIDRRLYYEVATVASEVVKGPRNVIVETWHQFQSVALIALPIVHYLQNFFRWQFLVPQELLSREPFRIVRW